MEQKISEIFLKQISTVKVELDENQIDKFRDFRNSVSHEFQNYFSPLETTLFYIDQLFELNERNKSFCKRRELSTQLKFNVIFLAIWRSLMDENKL